MLVRGTVWVFVADGKLPVASVLVDSLMVDPNVPKFSEASFED